jgi:predicted ATPase
VADRQPLFFSARRFVEELSSRGPLLLVFEDIHWADASQLDLLESLASRVRDVPVMFLALARPELLDSRPTWGAGLMSHTSMQLYSLSSEDARTLAEHLLPMLSGLRGAADRVVITAEGNPLFIEELVASLAERVEEATEKLPTNVRTTIAARLDTLPAAARGALLDAAVIGKVFWRGALQTLEANRSAAELEDALDILEARDFIHREAGSQIQGDHEYVFKHMLIREVAYATPPGRPAGSGTPRWPGLSSRRPGNGERRPPRCWPTTGRRPATLTRPFGFSSLPRSTLPRDGRRVRPWHCSARPLSSCRKINPSCAEPSPFDGPR